MEPGLWPSRVPSHFPTQPRISKDPAQPDHPAPGRELRAPLALSNGRLVMCSQNEVVCVDLLPQ